MGRRQPGRIAVEAHAFITVARTGLIGRAPWRWVAMLRAMKAYGSLGGAIRTAAVRHGGRPGVVDELGILTFAELDRRSNALANAWRERGIAEGTGVGMLCRNHRGLLDAVFASAKLGVRALFLNTDFAGPQASEVCGREGVEALVYDAEFASVVAEVSAPKGRFVAWTDGLSAPCDALASERADKSAVPLESVIAEGSAALPPAPSRSGSLVVLTSGTTGTPKGAQRAAPKGFAIVGGLLAKIPYRSGEATYIAPPMFHGLGLINTAVSVALGNTVVTRRRFDPETVLADLAAHRCTGLVVVPVMLRRILDLDLDAIDHHDLRALRIIQTGGAQLGGPLAEEAMRVFGDVVYNLYGTTEAAYATIATPEDLRTEPSSVGSAPYGTTVRILDDDGRPVPTGVTGTVYVGNVSQSTGYTGGGGKPIVDGLMSTGDVGHLDPAGRLFIDGRDDDMIVSGGENLFPGEVAELLSGHPGIGEVAVIGVPDDDFGQALRAYVVRRDGRELTEDDVKAYVRDNLARYKVPRSVVFLDSLPRNPTGKVLPRELRRDDERRA